MRILLAFAVVAGCGQKDESPQPAAKPATSTENQPAPADAATPPSPPPAVGAHLDPSEIQYRPSIAPRAHSNAPKIKLVLRSTPSGASASIDGKAIGITPTYYEMPVDGRSHDFTFSKEGYSVARYRFVATHGGVVHGTLKKLVAAPDAGAAAE
jgi:hypothetical protein